MTKLVPGSNDFAMLQPLQWNTRYEVEITARNVKGLSEPTFYQFFMPQKPDITGKSMIKKSAVNTFSLNQWSPTPESVGLLAPGRTERMHKSHYISFIYCNVLFL